ncbi:APC family permease [bacterium]|nr:APC family permease [bacterium]
MLASDALSSNAYATEEIMHVLASAHRYMGGPPTLHLVLPITLAIAVLMFIIMASYRRAVLMYPESGGSYTVARKNLGATAGLVAGSALVIDYILTVAVSVSAGIAALCSYAPVLLDYKVLLALLLIVVISWVNLRGTKESGWTFAFPAYGFVGMMLILIGVFLWRYFTGGVHPLPVPDHAVQATTAFSTFLLLKAFSNGCAALTGVEAISNGVQIFRPPEAQNASKTLLLLILTSVTVFAGLGFAAYSFHILPNERETLVSQIARATFLGGGYLPDALGQLLFALAIGSVLAVLIVASNTAFADFPRLLAFIARDGYAPRVLLSQGDRLVYNRGILALMVISAGLVLFFQASVNLLIPLYAVGVFLCFTLSQAGMFYRIISDRQKGWLAAAAVNAIGTIATGSVMCVIAITKFSQGAWLVVVLIPLLVLAGRAIKRHYQWFERRLAVYDNDENPLRRESSQPCVICLISSDINRGTLEGLEVARALTGTAQGSEIRALHVELNPARTALLVSRFEQLVTPNYPGITLEIVPSPYRWLVQPVLQYIEQLQSESGRRRRIIVLLPEFETGNLFEQLLHNNSAANLRRALMKQPEVTIITNRFFLRK